jgi:hypothetical protein
MHVGLTWDLACVHVGTNEQRFIKRKKKRAAFHPMRTCGAVGGGPLGLRSAV